MTWLFITGANNISSVEDPVEIQFPGINQVNINPKAGLSFASTLRAFLRQDPDIIMIGEIRDLETAEMSIKAAQTGHLVLSTLHTNSAAETLTRLMNTGIAAFNIASTVSMIISQRLVRRLCQSCKVIRHDLPPDHPFANSCHAPGCEHCVNGYKGRIALFELLPISKDITRMILAGANSLDIHQKARASGMITLADAGAERIRQRVTSVEEINRIIME